MGARRGGAAPAGGANQWRFQGQATGPSSHSLGRALPEPLE